MLEFIIYLRVTAIALVAVITIIKITSTPKEEKTWTGKL